MIPCQCVTKTGSQCSRKAIQASQYCAQHTQKCDQVVMDDIILPTKIPKNPYHPGFELAHSNPNKNVPSTSAVINSSLLSTDRYNLDWRDHAKNVVISGYHLLVIPKGTILYSGVSVDYPDNTVTKNRYYSILNVALLYAFSTLMTYKNKKRAKSDLGKVITSEVTKDIYLLDMTKPDNYVQLRKDFAVETQAEYEVRMEKQSEYAKYDENDQLIGDYITVPHKIPYFYEEMGDIFYRAFHDGSGRVSEYNADNLISLWLCQNLNLDGWGLKSMNKYLSADHLQAGQTHQSVGQWPPELMLCLPERNLQRLPFEFRLNNTFNVIKKGDWDVYVLMTSNGQIIRQFRVDQVIAEENEILSNSWYYNLVQYPIANEYKGYPEKISDSYLFPKIN